MRRSPACSHLAQHRAQPRFRIHQELPTRHHLVAFGQAPVLSIDEYEARVPSYHLRHLVKPGITGWAQVSYPYGAGYDDAVEKLKYDLYYIRRFVIRFADKINDLFFCTAIGAEILTSCVCGQFFLFSSSKGAVSRNWR